MMLVHKSSCDPVWSRTVLHITSADVLPFISYIFSKQNDAIVRPKTRRIFLLSSYSSLIDSLLVGKFSSSYKET